jgi:hypothetical protein
MNFLEIFTAVALLHLWYFPIFQIVFKKQLSISLNSSELFVI